MQSIIRRHMTPDCLEILVLKHLALKTDFGSIKYRKLVLLVVLGYLLRVSIILLSQPNFERPCHQLIYICLSSCCLLDQLLEMAHIISTHYLVFNSM
jgi:hypothetical protein